jgi:hypothetical protein
MAFIHFLLTDPRLRPGLRLRGKVVLPRQKAPTIETLFPVKGNGVAVGERFPGREL